MFLDAQGGGGVTNAFYEALVEDDAEDLYDNAPCGYLSSLPDGTIVKVNRTFLTWTGYEREELVGKRRFQELLSIGGQIYYETHYGPLLQMRGDAREIAVEIVRADGRRLPALVNSVVTTDEAGRPAFVRTAVFDASARRTYERELLDARRRAEESEERARVLTQTLQQSLLPPAAPSIPGLEVAAAYRPAGRGDEVGGDFYDVFESRTGDWAIVMGDVQGKGVGAAVITALVRHTLRATAIHDPRPAHALKALNEVLVREQGDASCTVACARLRREAGDCWRLDVACGGHPLPLRLGPAEPSGPLGAPGTLLGVFETVQLTEVSTTLGPGDTVVFFTDGVTEARSDEEGFYGDDRLSSLLHLLREEDPAKIVRAVVEGVITFQDGHPRDDIAVLAVRVPPAPQA